MAIYQDIQITVNQGLAQPDKSLYIFRGDSNILLNFKLVTPQYMLTKDNKDNLISRFEVDSFELRLQLDEDYNRIIKGQAVENGVCSVLLTQNIIQQLRVGSYTYQITLIDADDNAIMTFPACNSKLNILDRLSLNAEEFVNGVEAYASFCNADTAILAIADEEPGDILDSNGDYNKKVWVNGDLIMASDLNRLEWISYLNRQLLNEHTSKLNTQNTHITNNTARLNEIHQEIVDARQSDSTSYSKLGDRLDAVDSQLAYIENDLTDKINSMTLNIKDFGSKGDIITDTQAFKDALNFESDIINIFFPKGTYNIDLGEYSLPNKKIILHGIKGESVLNGNSNSSFIISNNIEINNLTFNNWNSNRILELNNEIDINISNCYFNKCKIVLYCNSTYKTNIIKQLTFKDNYLEDLTSALRIGCLIESAIVENNTCINFSQTVFQVGLDNESKDDSYCLNFIGRNNIIKGLYAKESYRGFMLYAKHVILENNTIEDMKFNPPDFNGSYEDVYVRSGIYVRSSADYVVIKNNVFKNLSGWQIQIKDSYGYIYIEGNKVYADKEVEGLIGFHIASCDTLYCLNNEFSEVKRSNIIHSGADNNYILNNRIVNSKCVTAIKVASINSVIKNNHIEMEIPDGDGDYYNTYAIYNSIVGNGTINVSNNYIQNIGTNSEINFRGVRISYNDEYACKVLKVMNNTLFNVRNGIQLYSSSTSLAPTILQCIENTGIDILEKMVVAPTVDSKIHLIDNNYNK